MKVSQEAIYLLEELEGKSNTVYICPAGCPTIGIGHMLTKDQLSSGKIIIGESLVRYADGLNDIQIYALAGQDLNCFEEVVGLSIKISLNQNQFNALVLFTFNIGSQAFLNSTLRRLLNQGNYSSVPEQMRRWVHANGKVLQGLVRRREKEISLWNK